MITITAILLGLASILPLIARWFFKTDLISDNEVLAYFGCFGFSILAILTLIFNELNLIAKYLYA